MSAWGHKITVHIYVESDIEAASRVSTIVCDRLDDLDVDFLGVAIEAVLERPYDQGAES